METLRNRLHGKGGLPPAGRAQRGIALPVALIMMTVMLFSAIYLMRASNSATLMASGLAFERDISRRADFGLSTGYDWLSATSANALTKANLENDQAASGYNATFACAVSNCYRDAAFWTNSRTVNDPTGNPVEYVIHRMCQYVGAYNAKLAGTNIDNVCMQTTAVAQVSGGGVGAGTSLSSDSDAFTTLPQIHYVITARVPGVKGASVINQLIVMIGA